MIFPFAALYYIETDAKQQRQQQHNFIVYSRAIIAKEGWVKQKREKKTSF